MDSPPTFPDMAENANHRDSPLVVAFLAVLSLSRATELLTNTTADADLWGYLSFGRLYWKTGNFPYQDVFAYLPTLNPWIYHEWLTGVIFYPLYQALGAPGLQALKYALGFTTLWIIFATARRRGAGTVAAIVTLFLVQGFLATGYSPVRAQVFTYAFFPLTLYILETARLTGRLHILWLLVPIQVVWANLHGGFLAGLGLIFLYGLGEALSRRPFYPFGGILALAGLATLINPYGLKYWGYMISGISLPRSEITEWVSVWGAYQRGVFFNEFLIFSLVLAITLLFYIWARRWELTPILVFVFVTYLGLRHLRHQVFFYLVLGAYLPSPLTSFLQVMRSDPHLQIIRHSMVRIMATLLGALIVLFYAYQTSMQEPFSLKLPPLPKAQTKSQIYYPTGAVAYIKEYRLTGNLLTEFNWGEYLIWTLYPQCHVSLDGRYETVYPQTICLDYFDFINGRANWQDFLKKYPPAMILIDSRSKIYDLLKNDRSWLQVYKDAGAALFLPSKEQTKTHPKSPEILSVNPSRIDMVITAELSFRRDQADKR
jgi:hypothetical protein